MLAVIFRLAGLLIGSLLWLTTAFGQPTAVGPLTGQVLGGGAQQLPLLEQWLSQGPFRQQYQQPQLYHLQILFTEIKRDPAGVSLTHHQYRPDAEYFYPASTVKLPVAVLALEYLRQRQIAPNSLMLTGAAWPGDTTRPSGLATAGLALSELSAETKALPSEPPSVAEDVRRILLLSDNDAYNRLYELLGPAYINRRLTELGFTPVQIRHRLERFLTIEQNHQLPPVMLLDSHAEPLLSLPTRQDPLTPLRPATLLGEAHWRDGVRFATPLDFASRNQWTLHAMHRFTLLLSETLPAQANSSIQLAATDTRLLDYYRQISLPRVKFLYYGASGELDESIVIRNKVGDAYGFFLDTGWFCDRVSGREFVLSAVIYANSDAEIGDSRYDDKTLAMPYLQWLGRTAVAHVREQASQSPASAQAVAYCEAAAALMATKPM